MSQSPVAADNAAAENTMVPVNRRRRLKWPRKLMFAGVATVMLLTLLEAGLALLGVQPISRRRDSFVGFAGRVRLFIPQDDYYTTNPLKLSYFNQQSFSAKKAPGTVRVFCLGGSTTFGHPYEDPTSFCGWLRQMLSEAESHRNWEVINCGGVSYASYREAILMNELIEYEPDLFIVCTGHNEFLEERSYSKLREPDLQTRAAHAVSTLRISGVIDDMLGGSQGNEKETNRLAAEVDVILDHTDGPETYHRNPELRRGVTAHFRESLLKIVNLAHDAGAKVILVKPESNLKDFSPFKSEPSRLDFGGSVRWEKLMREAREARAEGKLQEAVELLLQASRLDPHHAEALFQTASALFEANRADEAARFYLKARDEDVCPLRAPTELMEIVAETAAAVKVPLVNFQEIIASRSQKLAGHRLPGDECFLDHVHPTIEAHGDLAVALFETMQTMGLAESRASAEQVRERVRERVTGSLGKKEQALALTRVAQVLAWAGKNSEGLRSAKQAVDLCPDNSAVVSQYGRMLENTGSADEAFAQYQAAARLDPSDSLTQSRLAAVYFLKDDYRKAREHWEHAMATTPESAPLSFRVELHMRVGDCHTLMNDREAGQKEYRIALTLDPDATEVLKRLNR